MSNKMIDLTNQKYGRLTVVSQKGFTSSGNAKWLCECECGNVKIVSSATLRSGGTKSCGCYIREITSKRSYIHGETKSRLHHIWSTMKARCNDKKSISYQNYGGRGIKVCGEWESSYVSFRNWALNNGYDDSLTIDRKDNDGNYEPNNCRWTTNLDQQNNKSNSRFITIDGITNTVTEWGRKYNIDPQAIWGRLYRGWNERKAVTTPSNIKHRRKKWITN